MRLENTGWILLAQDYAQCKVPVTAMDLYSHRRRAFLDYLPCS